MSKVSENTSVETTSFSRAAVCGAPAGAGPAGLADDGTLDAVAPGKGVGTDALPLPVAVAAVTAGLVGTGLGKKVALLPLKTCH